MPIVNPYMRIFIILAILSIVPGCYSFRGISIPPDINTFNIENFDNRASNAPATIDQVFSETLRDKIRRESRLQLVEVNPDIVFKGSITAYRITSEAPVEGNTVAFNKLTISVSVEYVDNKNEDNNWKKTFSFYQDFDSTADFQSLQEEFNETIFNQIVEDIFNQSFTNW